MRKTKRFAAASAIVLGAMGVGIAFAAWTANGTGSGSAAAINGEDISAEEVTVDPQLYPGAFGDLELVIKNPNPYAVEVTEINNRGVGFPITADDLDCNAAASVSFTDASDTWIVPAADENGDGELAVTLDDAVYMNNDANDDCQGATFTVPVSLVGESYVAPAP